MNAARGATALTGVGAGGPACNGNGLPAYQLAIPTASLYFGDIGGVPAALGANILVDLYEVQQAVLRVY